jgi:hypothetical protein
LRWVFGDFKVTTEFEGHHGIAGFFEEQSQLARRVPAATSAPNTSGNLFPIGHLMKGIVTARGRVRPEKEIVRIGIPR